MKKTWKKVTQGKEGVNIHRVCPFALKITGVFTADEVDNALTGLG